VIRFGEYQAAIEKNPVMLGIVLEKKKKTPLHQAFFFFPHHPNLFIVSSI